MRRVCYLAAAAFVLLALPASAQSSGREIVVPPTLQGTLICATGDTLLLGGPDTLRDFQMCMLSADRHRVPGQTQSNDPLNPRYAFRWAAGTAGPHRLTVEYVLENQSVVSSRRFVVLVQSAPPLVLSPLPAQFYGAAAGKDLPVSVQAAPDFHASKVDFFLDGAPVGSVTSAPFAFTLPLGGVLAGPHRAFVQATDTLGDVYVSPVQTVMVVSGSAPGETTAGSASAKGGHPAPASQGAQAARKAKKSGIKGKKRPR